MWYLRNLQRSFPGPQTLYASQSSREILKCLMICHEQVRTNKVHRQPSKVIIPDSENPLKVENVIELDRKGVPKNISDEQIEKLGRNIRSRSKARIVKTFTELPEKYTNNFDSFGNSKTSKFNETPKHDKTSKSELSETLNYNKTPELSEAPKSNRPVYSKIIDKIDQNANLKKSVRSISVLGKPIDDVFNKDGEVIYTKLLNRDTNVSQLLIKLKSKKTRGICGLIKIEGWRLIVDGLKAGIPLKTLLISDTDNLEIFKPVLPKKGVRIFKMPYRELQMWSDVETSSGIIGIFDTTKYPLKNCEIGTLPINIICDNIREPGNLGAILRMADGVGCRQVLLTGCVDLWDPKVLRSAAGAHFRLCIHQDLLWNDIKRVIPENSKIFIADNKCPDEIVHITCTNPTHSFTFEDRKKNTSKSAENENRSESFKIPLVPYYDVDYNTSDSISVIIGGETEGLSGQCYEFGYERNGLRVNIPLKDGVDSLNTGMALAVLVFEVKRQLLKASRSVKIDE